MTDYVRLDLGETRPGRYRWLAIGKYKDGTYWLQEIISHQSKFRDFGERMKFDYFFKLLDYLARTTVIGPSQSSATCSTVRATGRSGKWSYQPLSAGFGTTWR